MHKRFIVILAVCLISLGLSASINIWEGVEGHPNVSLTPYLAPGDGKHAAVIVCPGGSYFWHDMNSEGYDVAEWLQQNGLSAFVLKYRTGGGFAFATHVRLLFRGNRYPDPQDDLLQALRYVRQHADEFGINADAVGAMGFSAGGHLAMSAAELFNADERPAFVASIYPVVTMTQDCAHKRSRRGLMGDSRVNNKDLRDLLSLERHVPTDCPPVFLVNCKDDPIVDYRNSVLLDSALTAQGVQHIYFQYTTGGHGFGANDAKCTPECQQWKNEFLQWITKILKHDEN